MFHPLCFTNVTSVARWIYGTTIAETVAATIAATVPATDALATCNAAGCIHNIMNINVCNPYGCNGSNLRICCNDCTRWIHMSIVATTTAVVAVAVWFQRQRRSAFGHSMLSAIHCIPNKCGQQHFAHGFRQIQCIVVIFGKQHLENTATLLIQQNVFLKVR